MIPGVRNLWIELHSLLKALRRLCKVISLIGQKAQVVMGVGVFRRDADSLLKFLPRRPILLLIVIDETEAVMSVWMVRGKDHSLLKGALRLIHSVKIQCSKAQKGMSVSNGG